MGLLQLPIWPLGAAAASSEDANSGSSSRSATRAGSPFVWQPLPLRATFRPLNRNAEQPAARPPRPGRPAGEPLALTINERSISADSAGDNSFLTPAARATEPAGAFSASFFQPLLSAESAPADTSTTTTTTTTQRPSSSFEGAPDSVDDELPTRQPMTRFRPTRPASETQDSSAPSLEATNSTSTSSTSAAAAEPSSRAILQECFECICEASTSCNPQSRCQTSDVRHTRCGLFLISYDQWLATGLSRELVSREALARDSAADERAFYECVTQRDCAQRLLAIYMQRHRKDCDRDGRVDCYDLAAIHHSGMEQCASESLLDSQYWNDFNACFGFGRR